MNKIFIWTLIFVFIVSPLNSFAESDVNRVISSWQERYNNLSTYTATYTQSLYEGDTLKGKTSGTVFFKKPHFFRWEVESPENQIIVGDGEVIWIYLPKNKQIIKRSYSPEESFGPFWFTSTEPIKKIKQNFKVTRPFSVTHKGEMIEVLEFRPRKEIPGIRQVNLWLEPRNFLPLRVEVFSDEGSHTRFTYSDVKMNVPIPDELFKLKPREGLEVFEE